VKKYLKRIKDAWAVLTGRKYVAKYPGKRDSSKIEVEK